MNNFDKLVLDFCSKIPKGKVVTYSMIAREIGFPKSMRVIGNVLNKNKFLIKIPCHRVIKSNGEVGGYVKGTKEKINLLRKEGVKVFKQKVDLNEYLWANNK